MFLDIFVSGSHELSFDKTSLEMIIRKLIGKKRTTIYTNVAKRADKK